jgi:hypothetical protein
LTKLQFKNSIFRVIEYLTKSELSDQAKKLIVYYFNESHAPTSREKAIEAIEYYTQEKIPESEYLPKVLQALLEEMALEADNWDNE